jgi:hypothetical protein
LELEKDFQQQLAPKTVAVVQCFPEN